VLVTTKNESNTLIPEVWRELAQLDEIIHNVTIQHHGKEYRYADLCSRWGDQCYENDILGLGSFMEEVANGEAHISYPIAYHPYLFDIYITGHFLNGIEYAPDGYNLESVKSILLHYFLVSEGSPEEKER